MQVIYYTRLANTFLCTDFISTKLSMLRHWPYKIFAIKSWKQKPKISRWSTQIKALTFLCQCLLQLSFQELYKNKFKRIQSYSYRKLFVWKQSCWGNLKIMVNNNSSGHSNPQIQRSRTQCSKWKDCAEWKWPVD